MSDYTEHLISMAGGDGDQLAAIEAIIQPYASTVEERRGVHPDSVFTAAVDLLAMVREQRAALDRLMAELVAREARWKKAWEMEELTHDEAVSATQEDRWAYAQLAEIRAALTATEQP